MIKPSRGGALSAVLEDLGQRLKHARSQAGLKQSEIALGIQRLTGTRVSVQAVRNWERGRHEARREFLEAFAELCGVRAERFVGSLTDGAPDIDDPDLSLFFRGEWHEFTDDEKEFIKAALIERAEFVAKQKRETLQHGTEPERE